MLTGPKPLQAYLTYNIEALTSVQGNSHCFLDTLIRIPHMSFSTLSKDMDPVQTRNSCPQD